MFDRIASIATGGGRLLRAEGELLIAEARRSLLWLVIAAAGVTLAVGGTLGILAAGTMALAAEIGWVGAVASAGLFLLVFGVALGAVAKIRAERSMPKAQMPDESLEREADAKREMRGQKPNEGSSKRPEPDEDEGVHDKIMRVVLENPALIAGGALTAVALLGPNKTLRMVSRGAMLAGIASKLLDPELIASLTAQKGEPKGTPGGSPSGGPGPNETNGAPDRSPPQSSGATDAAADRAKRAESRERPPTTPSPSPAHGPRVDHPAAIGA